MLALALWRIHIQEAIQYRAESLVWLLGDVAPPIMMIFVWLAAYEGQSHVAGYDLQAMLGYTVGVMVLRNVVASHIEWDIDQSVRNGTLSTHLVRPFNVWLLWFWSGIAARTVRGVMVAPVILGCMAWFGPSLTPVSADWVQRLPAVTTCLVLAYVLSFVMKLVVGFMSFWLTDIYGLNLAEEVITYIFGGLLLPLELLPNWLQAIAWVLPFRAVYHLPLTAVLGRLQGIDLLVGIAIQAGWLAVITTVAWLLWRRGLIRYEAVGG